MNNLEELATWADPLLKKLGSRERVRLLRKLAITLRRENQRRIRNQKEPGGETFAPRKRDNKKPMFAKLPQARHIKATATPTNATVLFIKRAANIAAVHHFGLVDKVDNNGPKIKYPSRELLGFSDTDKKIITDFFISHLAQ